MTQPLTNIENLALATHRCEHNMSVGAKVIYDFDRQRWYLLHHYNRVLIFHCLFCGVELDKTLQTSVEYWNIVTRTAKIAKVIISRLADVRTDLFLDMAFSVYREQSRLRDFYDYGPMEEAMAYHAIACIVNANDAMQELARHLEDALLNIEQIKGPQETFKTEN